MSLLSVFDEALRVARPDVYYLRRNFLSVLVTMLVTPLLYFVSFCYGLGSSVSDIGGVSYVAFVIPGVVALSTLTSSFSAIANKVLAQRIYYTSFDEIVLCPLSPSAVILGKALVGFLKSMLACSILLAIGLLMSADGMHVTPMLYLCIAVSCLTFSFLGVLVGFISKSLTDIIMFTSLIVVPMTFLCGTVFSVSSLPEAVQYFISALPLTYSVECIRAAALGWGVPLLSLAVTAAFGAAFFAICHWMLVSGRISKK
ncbi:MAG: ABC transporter permease [Candidatus Methanoplasma sp.]|jgi:ABC-type polysaccharide/polyol phosphate export permease|nr:ABC transporter permease [Candidatus Methanoplasma sp.]